MSEISPRIDERAGGPGEPASLAERVRAAGVLLLACDGAGVLRAEAPVSSACGAEASEDWLRKLLTGSPLFRGALREAAARWAVQDEPQLMEVVPGCWLAATEQLERRRRVGYSVLAIITEPFAASEQLAAMCQSSRQDLQLCRGWIRKLPPVAPADVPRVATLVKLLHEQTTGDAERRRTVESVGQQLAESYEEINLLYTIIQSMTVVQQPARFVSIACEELLVTLPYAWIGAQLADDPETLKGLSGRLIVAGQVPGAGQSSEKLQRLTRRLLAEANVDAPMVLEPGTRPEHAAFAPLGRGVAAHPVAREGRVIGVLIAGDKRGPDPAVSSVDVKLLGACATHMGIFLENAALYDDLNAMFLGTLEAITASIDAKDRYTCGHSQRVAHLTRALGEAVGLDAQQLGRLHIAGLVHDVGKIGVPEAVLCKAGRLTDEEFGLIRKHPEIGHRILKDIPQLRDVLPGVLHHHERWDGRGYPHGLKGEAIPLVGRLIALADTFDAMSTNRAYRDAMPRNEVLAEIRRCGGSQFDPKLANVFVKLDFSQFDRMLVQHGEDEQLSAIRRGEAA